MRTISLYIGLFLSTAVVLYVIRLCDVPSTKVIEITPVAAVAAEASTGVVPARPANARELLIAVAVIIATARLFGWLFHYALQPPVIGEIIAGIALGPSLLGFVAPSLHTLLLPSAIAPALSIVAQLGVLLYLFLVGMEVDFSVVRNRACQALAISHVSIVAPFLLGAGLAIYLYPEYSNDKNSLVVFAAFVGTAMSITAFPVLARIITDRQIAATPLGSTALACAAADDITSWCMLSVLIGVAHNDGSRSFWVPCYAVGYAACLLGILRPRVTGMIEKRYPHGVTSGGFAAIIIGMLLSALFTEVLGVHALFGAFLFGTMIPFNSPAARDVVSKCRPLVTTLLLPVYFAITGMRMEIGLLDSRREWLICAAITAVATLGKFGGTLFASLVTGSTWREAASLGILMNTRGLMEIIVLNVGLDLGIISPTLYAMMVIMAIATTIVASPLLYWIAINESRRTVQIRKHLEVTRGGLYSELGQTWGDGGVIPATTIESERGDVVV